jgi:predicted RND superfamily exporter protein
MASERASPGGSAVGKSYVESLSASFERIGAWSYDHRWIVLSICLLLLGASAVFAARVRFDNSFEAFFDQNDLLYVSYLQFREDFGSDEISYILYEAPEHPHGPWDLEVMRKIKMLTEALEDETPFVKEVTSLTNVEFLEGVHGGIEIHGLLEELPESQEALLEVRRQALNKPMYVGGLVSRDAQYGAIMIELEKSSIDPLDEIRLDPEGGDGLENLYPQVTYESIQRLLARPEYQGIDFYHTGDVPLNAVYNRITVSEFWILGSITITVIGLMLVFFFRRASGVVGPLTVVSLSVLVAVAQVGLVGWELDLMFSMLPTLLIAVGVADSVHIISEFRAYHVELGDRREAVRRTMYLVGTPCLLTSLTTAAGFTAMSIAPIKAISHFAIYSAVGVLAAFLLSVTLLMFFLSFGRKTSGAEGTGKEQIQLKGGRFLNQGLAAIARFDIRYRRAIIVFFAVLFIFSGFGIARLKVDSNFLTEFSEDVPIRHITSFVDNTMGGAGSFVYLFDTGVPDGIKEPAVLREIERLQAEADTLTDVVTKTYSIVDVLKDINQSFHEGDPAYHVLPETRELVAQYLLIYEMSGGEEVEEYVSSDYSRASLEIRVKLVETSSYAEMVAYLDSHLQEQPLQASTVTITGIGALWLRLMDYITESQIRGILLAFTAIAAMMCFVFRSIKIGLFAMIPNISPVVLTVGIMGWLDIPLDYTRLLIATVAIGISVDDTIHHVTRYIYEFQRCRDYREALFASMKDVGRALVITSAVLVAGFLVFLFSAMDSQATFGILLASTILVALVADFFLMPALVMTFKPFGEGPVRREDPRPSSGSVS